MDHLHIQTIAAEKEVLEARATTMAKVENMCRSQTQWYQTATVADYRKLRAEGIGFPKPWTSPEARLLDIVARNGHKITLRIIATNPAPKGTLLHFHAGGFVIGSAASYDAYLTDLSQKLDLTAVSVEYRLAPEDPYPAAQEDAEDAALFALSNEGIAQLGGPLRILAGESAGGYLATSVAIALRDLHSIDVRNRISAILASYPIYDFTGTPSLLQHDREAVLSRQGMQRFIDAYLRDVPRAEWKQANISILHAKLQDLPPALFLCGTEDPLVDDTVFMATRWALQGSEAHLVLVPGAWHAFTIIPAGEVTQDGLTHLKTFAKKAL